MTDPEDGGSTARISDGTRPQDPGGGEAQIVASRDIATAWPMTQTTSRPVLVRQETVGMSAVLVDATPSRRDWIMSSISDSGMMVAEGF